MQQHRQEHCHLSNGGQHHVQTVEHMDGEEGIRGVEELEMKSLPVRIGCTNENSGDSPAGITRGSGSLLGHLNGGMNYPTILPSFVCSCSSESTQTYSNQCRPTPEQHLANLTLSQHNDILNRLHQLLGQRSKRTKQCFEAEFFQHIFNHLPLLISLQIATVCYRWPPCCPPLSLSSCSSALCVSKALKPWNRNYGTWRKETESWTAC